MCDYKMREERCKEEFYLFPVLSDCNGAEFNIARVYPLKQRASYAISKLAKSDARIKHICLIGSSVSMKCTNTSDIDLIIQLTKEYETTADKNSVSEAIQDVADWGCDILWYDRLQEEDGIYGEIRGECF